MMSIDKLESFQSFITKLIFWENSTNSPPLLKSFRIILNFSNANQSSLSEKPHPKLAFSLTLIRIKMRRSFVFDYFASSAYIIQLSLQADRNWTKDDAQMLFIQIYSNISLNVISSSFFTFCSAWLLKTWWIILFKADRMQLTRFYWSVIILMVKGSIKWI